MPNAKNKAKDIQTESRVIMRSQLRFADYNPRHIDDEAYRRLKANIRKRGLMGGVVWNELTGNLVGAHQRMKIMDELKKYNPDDPATDYEVRVDVVQLTDKEEKEQNLFLNSKSVQGRFNNDLLAEMLPDIDVDAAGLTDMDLAIFAPADTLNIETDDLKDLFSKKKPDSQPLDNEGIGIDQAANAVKTAKAEIKENAGNKAADKLLAYVTLNFPDMATKVAFMQRFNLDPYDTFVDGVEFGEMCEAVIN